MTCSAPARAAEHAGRMRENGVEDVPDPGENGIIEHHGGPGPQQFDSASGECDDLRPEDRGGHR